MQPSRLSQKLQSVSIEVGDIPGVRFKVVKADGLELYCLLLASPKEGLGQATAAGGRLWPGRLVQEQEGALAFQHFQYVLSSFTIW